MAARAGQSTRADAGAPLAGVRVLDLGTVYAAPIAAMILGDLGADVIKIEHQDGDPARTHGYQKDGVGLWWKVIARNKRTITLDLSREAGADLLKRLARKSDVLIENFRPGVLERWGIGPEELLEMNPTLIALRLTGFGQSGPYAEHRAFGTLIESMSTLAHMTGESAGPPTLPPFGLADGVAAYAGASAVLAALLARTADGLGQVIDLALLDPLLSILGPAPSAYQQLGVVPHRHGNASPNNAPRNTYLTKDNRWIAISSSTNSVARRVMKLVGREDLAAEPWFDSASARASHRESLDAIVADWVARRSRDDALAAFRDAGAAAAPIYDIADLMADPQVRWRGSIVDVPDEDLGVLAMQNTVFRFSRSLAGIRHAGRAIGADNRDVYGGLLGLSTQEIEALSAEGVI